MHFPVFSSSLAHLALYLHTDMPMATLVDHVCAFPFLESLYIGGSASYSAIGEPRAREPPPRLKTLIISDPVFADWILSLDLVPTQISTVVLRDIRLPYQWAAINRYLSSAAATVIHSLTLQGCDSQDQYISRDLQHLVELRDLIVEHSRPVPSLLDVLSGLRRSPACETLETIQLRTGNPHGFFGAQDHCHALDEILADGAVFPHLRRVAFRVRIKTAEHPDFPVDYSIPKALTSQLHQNMALCSRRGLIFTP